MKKHKKLASIFTAIITLLLLISTNQNIGIDTFPFVSRIISFANSLHTVSHGPFTYWLFYLIFFWILFIPGYSLIYYLSKAKKEHITRSDSFVFAPVLSIIAMFVFGLIFILTKNKLTLIIFVPFLLITSIYFLSSRAYKDMFQSKKYLTATLLAITIIFITVEQRDYLYGLNTEGLRLDTTIPVPITGYTGYYADSITPWRIARFYYSTEALSSSYAKEMLQDIVIHERTPLLPIITTVIIGIFGESHFVYQRFLEVLTVLFFIVVFYFINSFTSSKIKSYLIYLILLINVQLSLMSFNVELFYKYFAAFPILIASGLLSRKPSKKIIQLQVLLLTLSFLIHPYTIIISVAFIISSLIRLDFNKSYILAWAKWSLPLLIFVGTWYSASKVITLPEGFNRTSSIYFQDKTRDEKNIFQSKAINLVQLITPNPKQQSIDPDISLTPTVSRYQFLRYSLVSNLTPIVFIFLLFNIFNFKKNNREMLYLGLLPLLIFWMVYLNKYNQTFDCGGSYFLLYHFSVPVLLTYTITNIKSKMGLIISVVSYIAWMTWVLINIGDPFTTPPLPNTTAYYLSLTQILLFAVMSITGIILSIRDKGLTNKRI